VCSKYFSLPLHDITSPVTMMLAGLLDTLPSLPVAEQRYKPESSIMILRIVSLSPDLVMLT